MDPEEYHPNGAHATYNIVVNKSAGEREQVAVLSREYVAGIACYLAEIKMFLHTRQKQWLLVSLLV